LRLQLISPAASLAASTDSDSELGEYDASATTIRLPFIRKLDDPNVEKTCRGTGKVFDAAGLVPSIRGLNGERRRQPPARDRVLREPLLARATAGAARAGGPPRCGLVVAARVGPVH